MKNQSFLKPGLLILISFFTVLGLQANIQQAKELRQTGDFSQIKLSCSADVYITQASSVKVEVEGNPEQLKHLKTINSDGVLEITIEALNLNFDPIKVYVSVVELNKIILNASGDIRSTNTLNSSSFEVRQSGSGDIDLALKTRDLKVSINGSGDVKVSGANNSCEVSINGSGDVNLADIFVATFKAKIMGSGNLEVSGSTAKLEISQSASGDVDLFGMPAEESIIKISGSGNVYVSVSKQLDVKINGSGDVRVKGKPQYKNVDVNGSGRVSYE